MEAFSDMKFERSDADPCLYYRRSRYGLIAWVSWIDDCLVVGSRKAVGIAKRMLMNRFDCEDIGIANEYVGCKLTRDHEHKWMKITQPVLLQSYEDEFDLPENECKTPAVPGQVLMKCDRKDALPAIQQKKFRSKSFNFKRSK